MNIDKVSAHFGSDTELAQALGVTVGAISQWRMKKFIPPGRQYQIQVLTVGKFVADRDAKWQASATGTKRAVAA